VVGRRHEIPRLQGDFYRDQFRKLLRWIFMTMMLIFVLLVAILYVIFFYEPTRRFYANTTDGKILDMPQPRYQYGSR
jgi:hypothetical protein